MDDSYSISLAKLAPKLGKVHVKIDGLFLKELLTMASGDDCPHRNLKLINNLEVWVNPHKNYSPILYGWINYNKTIPLNKLIILSKLAKYPWNLIEQKIISIKSGSNNQGEVYPKLPFVMEFELGSIVGHILGDGSIDSRYQQVFYSNSDKSLLKEFSDYMVKIFEIKPRIWMQKRPDFGKTKWDKRLDSIENLQDGRNCGLFYPSICGRILNGLFDNFALGFNKSLSNGILKHNLEFKRGLIKAFYGDEGSIMKGSNSIRLFQDRKEILKTFRKLLKEFKIDAGEIKKYMKRNKERYYFNIYKKSNFMKFSKEIGFTSLLKRERLNKLLIIKNAKNSK